MCYPYVSVQFLMTNLISISIIDSILKYIHKFVNKPAFESVIEITVCYQLASSRKHLRVISLQWLAAEVSGLIFHLPVKTEQQLPKGNCGHLFFFFSLSLFFSILSHLLRIFDYYTYVQAFKFVLILYAVANLHESHVCCFK